MKDKISEIFKRFLTWRDPQYGGAQVRGLKRGFKDCLNIFKVANEFNTFSALRWLEELA
jgi:hypothetical protein